MRIAIVNERYGAGAGRCASDMQSGFSRRHEVLLFPRDEHDNKSKILDQLASFKPDVVHCHSFHGNLPYHFLPDVSQLYPTCFTVHDPRPIGTMEVPCWDCAHNDWCVRCPMISVGWKKVFQNPYAKLRFQKRRCHQRCASNMRVVAPSEWMRGRLVRSELSRFEPVCIPNGVDLRHFCEVPDARRALGWPEKGFVLLYVAYSGAGWWFNDRKGLRVLADAFLERILPIFPDTILAVAGERIVPNHPNVRPLGLATVESLPMLYSASDLFINPTLADTSSYTGIEAMACGRAVVGSRVGGIPEVVQDGETGVLFPAGDAGSLGAAVVGLLERETKLRAMGKAGKMRAIKEFSLEKSLAAYEELFEGMAAKQCMAS